MIVDWRGVSRAGLAYTGRLETDDLEHFVRTRYRNGWRWLLVVSSAGHPVGGINDLYGRRGWWSE